MSGKSLFPERIRDNALPFSPVRTRAVQHTILTLRKRQSFIAGIDEAGRGPLAGPLALACVWCVKTNQHRLFPGIRDSKKLTARARAEWFLRLKSEPRIAFCATLIGPRLIDQKGVSWVLREGVRRLVRRFAHTEGKEATSVFYLDGGLFAPTFVRQRTIIRGDEMVPIISAASIVAKVLRDRVMLRLHRRLPEYGFDLHKGYGTRLHYERLQVFGLSSEHRRRFCKKLL